MFFFGKNDSTLGMDVFMYVFTHVVRGLPGWLSRSPRRSPLLSTLTNPLAARLLRTGTSCNTTPVVSVFACRPPSRMALGRVYPLASGHPHLPELEIQWKSNA